MELKTKQNEMPMLWGVNTAQLLKEIILNNPSAWNLKIPLQIFGILLAELGEISAEINNPKLNAMMCRLAIYECADQYSENYNKELAEATIIKGYPKNKVK